jgi:hypothetical protein
MDYTQSKQKDTKVRIKAPTDLWEGYLEKGLYDGVVYDVPDFKPSKNNDNVMVLYIPIQLLSGANKGKKDNYFITFNENSLKVNKRIFDAVGFKYVHDRETGILDFDCAELKGVQLKAQVAENTYKGKTTNKIVAIFNKDYVPEE